MINYLRVSLSCSKVHLRKLINRGHESINIVKRVLLLFFWLASLTFLYRPQWPQKLLILCLFKSKNLKYIVLMHKRPLVKREKESLDV